MTTESIHFAAPPRHRDEVTERLAGVSREQGLDPLARRLDQLGRWLGDDLRGVELELSVVASEERDVAEQSARRLLERPGKRIRASAALLAGRLGPKPTSVRDVAIASELVHAATLLHDDVLDEGTERRGGTAARVLYGNSASILGGDHLLIEALRLVERFGDPAHLRALFGVIGEMIRAEAVQLERRGKIAALLGESAEGRRAAYLDVARGKTAALFRWALAAGARASGLDAEAAEQAGRFGEALGIAFQLVDDVIDIEGDSEITGKNALADLREGKLTWPLLEALERSTSFRAALAGVEDLEPHRERVLAALRETDALRHTREAARAWVDLGLAALRTLPESAARDSFEALAVAGLHRAR
jgi:octaprenyl-diphosphate synthase